LILKRGGGGGWGWVADCKKRECAIIFSRVGEKREDGLLRTGWTQGVGETTETEAKHRILGIEVLRGEGKNRVIDATHV